MKRWLRCILLLLIMALGLFGASGEESISNVYHAHENAGMKIALTFDDGPHPRLTPEILAVLKKYDVPATFFLVGV